MRGTYVHPRTGEVYAVETGAEGKIIRAAGPLDAEDRRACESDEHGDVVDAILTNNHESASQDGAWLEAERERSWTSGWTYRQ